MYRCQGLNMGNTYDLDIELWSQEAHLNGLNSALPKNTKWVSQNEREAQLSERFASCNVARNF
jgi:hypothetical protein